MSEQKSTIVNMDTRAQAAGSHAASTSCQCLGCTLTRGEMLSTSPSDNAGDFGHGFGFRENAAGDAI